MSSLALFWLLQTFSIAACLFAFVKGGTAERLGAGTIVLNTLLATVIETRFPPSVVQISQITLDALTALSLLALALRYASLWLGAVMLLYATQFALHAAYLVLERPRDMLHFTINNLCVLAVNLALVFGTVMAWRERLRKRAATAPGLQPAP